MKKTILNFLVVGALAPLMLNSCKKAETGPKGDKGDTGAAGTNGNANVKSRIYTNPSWVYENPSMVALFYIPEITQDIVTNGLVQVAIEDNPNHFVALPLTVYATGIQAKLDYEYYASGIKIYWTNSENTQPGDPGNIKFKVTIMAGTGFRQIKN